jgi:hypothetical protein
MAPRPAEERWGQASWIGLHLLSNPVKKFDEGSLKIGQDPANDQAFVNRGTAPWNLKAVSEVKSDSPSQATVKAARTIFVKTGPARLPIIRL